MPNHYVSLTCNGEYCGICRRSGEFWPSTHKIGEEIPTDDPIPNRHNLTQYVCCRHFMLIMGNAVDCIVVKNA